MPIYTQIDHEEILTVLADQSHVLRLRSGWFERAYITENANGERRVNPGLIVALNSASNKYVPYHASAMYGPGSDTAVGVLDKLYFVTHDEVGVTPVAHGKLIEAHCYLWGGALGTVSGTIKGHLDDIVWV